MTKSTAAQAAPKRLGRPPVPADKAKSEAVLIKMTPAQREKLAALGGPEWVRQRIDRAQAPVAPVGVASNDGLGSSQPERGHG